MKRVFLMLGALASVSACTHQRPFTNFGPIADQGASRRVCDVDSLALERQRLVSESRQFQVSFGPPGGPPPTYAPPPPPDVPPNTEVVKMRDFDAEIDAQYRAVTASCRAYIQCMENSRYDERNCHDARDQWSSSQDRFLQLAVRLREIEEHVHRPYPRGDGRYGSYGSSIGGFDAPVRYPERGD